MTIFIEMIENGFSEAEKKVLELVAQRKLITKQEITSFLKDNGFSGKDVNLMRLNNSGYMKVVEGMGTVFIVTKKGQEFLRELE